ncbi:MAG: hypothetical protein GTO22_21385 [Gemmatimonadales bacterium]|nr:hypothetical protein [Gemmatimonadales bacterium]
MSMDLRDYSTEVIVEQCVHPWTEASWSPDGSRIAFTGSCEEGNDRPAIYMTAGNGTGVRRIGSVLDFVPTGPPSWASSGRNVALSIGESLGSSTIVVVDTGTGATTTVGRGYAPSWAPTGERIAYLQVGSGEDMVSSIRVMHSDGGGDVELVPPAMSEDASAEELFDLLPRPPLVWSRDGSRVAFGRGQGVWMVDVASLALEEVVLLER